jgi:hypothetical protein
MTAAGRRTGDAISLAPHWDRLREMLARGRSCGSTGRAAARATTIEASHTDGSARTGRETREKGRPPPRE